MVLTGTVYVDSLTGTANNDQITGADGADAINGGGGNDVIFHSSGGATLNGGAGDDAFGLYGYAYGQTAVLATGTDTVDGGDGDDEITLFWQNLTTAAVVTLLDTGVYSASATGLGVNGTSIERLWFYGGAGADSVRGAGGIDYVEAGVGDDVVEGGAGADDLRGGDGIDTLSYEHSSSGVMVTLQGGNVAGGDAAGDTIQGFENLRGSAFADVLGGAGTNGDLVEGLGGDDTLIGQSAIQTLDGGDGFDHVSYAGSAAGVEVHLNTGQMFFGDAAGDTLTNIEGVIGSNFADHLVGTDGVSDLQGGMGDDVLFGAGGADTLDGGAGSDTASYQGSNVGVRVRLFAGTAEFGHAAGDVLTSIENLTGSSFNDQLAGDDGDNIIEGGGGSDTLGGRGGFDTLSYAGSSAAVVINLSNQTAAGGDAAGDTFTGFEAVIGSSYGDTLNGGNGDQTVEGGLGNDRMNGGNGYDTLSYRNATIGVTVTLAVTTAQATGMGNDYVSNFERIVGSRFADSLTGDGGDNVLIGGAGGDALHGGLGIDAVDYSDSATGVSVDLGLGTGSAGDAAGDSYTGIENVIGSAFQDTLVGDGGDNVLTGGVGGDTLDGGLGTDTASYAASDAAVIINLGSGTATGGHADGDTLTAIEDLVGSGFDDVLIGDFHANTLMGGAGADVLDGEGGDDWISYAGSTAVTVNLTTGVGSRGHATGDSISDVENVSGSDYSDLIYGSSSDNHLIGLAGNDILQGRNGDDILDGGLGNDKLNGGNGADLFVFYGATGSDTIQDFSVASGDVIQLDPSIFADFADVLAHTTDVGSNAVISKAGVTITLTGVLKAQLLSDDFDFVSPAPLLGDGKDGGALVVPGQADDLDPLILPAIIDGKADFEQGPEVCADVGGGLGTHYRMPFGDVSEHWLI